MKQKEITKEEHIKNLIKNYNLLRIAEKIEARKTVFAHSSFFDKKLIVEEEKTNKVNENLLIKQEIKLEKRDSPHQNIVNNFNETNQKCKKHGLIVHSYAIGTNLLFCDKCIQETNLKTYPLPYV